MADDIVRVVEKHADGATIEQLGSALDVPRRTLQRRLAELVSTGRLRAIGRARQRRYQLAVSAEAGAEELAVSPAGQHVRELVRRPQIQRTPVGYMTTFLEQYRPNHDFYLDADTRARL